MPLPAAVPIIAAGLPAVGSAIGSIFDVRQRSKDVKSEIRARKEEAELAYQRSIEMWHMQNAYNSPEEQMKRFGAAGLNPHLIYGQGSSGNANQMPQYQPPNIQMQGASPPYGSAVSSVLPMLMSVGSWMQNMRMSEVEINRRETDVEKMEQMIDFLRAKYPHEIRGFDQKESLWPYQKSALHAGERTAWSMWNRVLLENRHLYGVEEGEVGMRELERLLKAEQARHTGLQADWLSPTRVFGMVNGLLGKFLRPGRSISNVSRGGKVVERFDRSGRRVYRRTE